MRLSRILCRLFLPLALLPLPAFADGILTTAQALSAFIDGSQQGERTFALTGTVTFCEAHTNQSSSAFVLQDATGNAEILNFGPEGIAPGTRVFARGMVRIPATLEPWMKDISVRTLGHAPAPEPVAAKLEELQDSAFALRRVCVRATVIDTFADDLGIAYDFLLLKDGATTLVAACPHSPRHTELIDATIELTGLVRRQLFGARKYVGVNLSVADERDIRVVRPAPANPFRFPELERAIYTTPKDVLGLGKRTARGVVLATWKPNNCLIRTDDHRLIRLMLANGEALPDYGAHVTAVGLPATDSFRVNLSRVRLRKEADRPFDDDAPVPVTGLRLYTNHAGERAFDDALYGRLVTLRGIVRDLPTSGSRCMALDCGGISVPVDCTAHPDALREVTHGNVVEVAGRCILDIGQWQPHDVFPRITGLSVVVRTPRDVRIVVGNPWWTPRRLLAVIFALVLALAFAYLRSRMLKRVAKAKLGERTQLAVELHDSLSQTLTGLACQITAAEKDPDLASARAKLAKATRMLQSCRTELRNCLFDLKSNLIAEKSFDTAVRRVVAPFRDQAEIIVRFNVRRELMDDATAHAVLAMIRELTANAIRHGRAWTVRIAGTIDRDALRFSVADDGCGFDPNTRPGANDGHFGLDGIKERIERLNGTLAFAFPKRGGTKAVVRIPRSKK